MSPARPTSSKRNPSNGFKPYTRGTASIGDSYFDVLDSNSVGTNSPRSPSLNDNAPHTPVERPGFPSYAQYKQVEAAYIQSLTPRRQGKALISQAMFDRIWDVLHQPDIQGETAQFRFWARKMFTLSRTHRIALNGTENYDNPPQEVLLHDNLLVAVQEQLYDLLCHCHGSTGHGGRDKTCALIRKYYTWVPKDLVASFIKACPTCIMKKCGNFDSALANQMAEQDAGFFRKPRSGADNAALPALPVPAPSSGYSWPILPASDEDSVTIKMEEVDPIETAYREAVQRARNVKASLSGMAVSNGSQSAPMYREVSLYKGLPNGWQYRHSDYASAHAEFMSTKGTGVIQDSEPGVRYKRPRIPSILPLWGPEHFKQEEYEVQETNGLNLLSMAEASQQHDSEIQDDASLQYLLLCTPQPSLVDYKEEPQSFGRSIDPMLMQFSAESASQASDTITMEADNGLNQATKGNNTSLNVPMSLKRAAAPPRLDLDFSTGNAFMTYRSPLREADITPDSPLMGLNWEQAVSRSPSETDSPSFRSSQLSVFTVPPMSATTSISPASSALRTPVDEFPNGTNEIDIGLQKGKIKVQPVEIELSDGIQQVCGL